MLTWTQGGLISFFGLSMAFMAFTAGFSEKLSPELRSKVPASTLQYFGTFPHFYLLATVFLLSFDRFISSKAA